MEDIKAIHSEEEIRTVSENQLERTSERTTPSEEHVKDHETIQAGVIEVSDVKVENQVAPAKKITKTASKTNSKKKVSVPKPFSLATDKRLSRERREGAVQPPKQKLSQTTRLRAPSKTPIKTQQSSSVRSVRSSDKTRNTSGNGKTIRRAGESIKDNTESASSTKDDILTTKNKAIDRPQIHNISEENKAPPRKAPPAPSFHNRSAPSRPEIKRVASKNGKSPLLALPGHQKSKSMVEIGTKQSETTTSVTKYNKPLIGSTTTKMPTPATETRASKRETVNKTTKTISSTAKETSSRVLKGSWSSPGTKQREYANGASCSDKLQKGTASNHRGEDSINPS